MFQRSKIGFGFRLATYKFLNSQQPWIPQISQSSSINGHITDMLRCNITYQFSFQSLMTFFSLYKVNVNKNRYRVRKYAMTEVKPLQYVKVIDTPT